MSDFAQIFDISHYQNVEFDDIEMVKKAGFVGVMVKATQGGPGRPHSVDPLFNIRQRRLNDLGFPWGCYHFLDWEDPVEEQVKNVLAVTGGDYGPMGFAIDAEPYGRSLTPGDAAQFVAMVSAVGLPANLMVYMSPDTERVLGVIGDPLRRWVASWGSTVPAAPWEFWQHTEKGTVPGVKGNVDLSFYNGTEAEFLQKYGFPAEKALA